MEWLDKGVYRWEPQHPPLARVAAALGPYLSGVRSQNTPNVDDFSFSREGLSILYHDRRYDRTLMLARLGILPFFWIACGVVYQWGRRYYGAAAAVAAVFLFSFLPPVLAHASVATTDMAFTAFLGAAFLTGMIWLEQPTLKTGKAFSERPQDSRSLRSSPPSHFSRPGYWRWRATFWLRDAIDWKRRS